MARASYTIFITPPPTHTQTPQTQTHIRYFAEESRNRGKQRETASTN